MAIGNNRHLFKQVLQVNGISTPLYKFVKDLRSNFPPEFEPPYIVKLNESGGSVGIDNHAVKETIIKVVRKVEELEKEYKIPVLIEKFIDGLEVTCVVFEDNESKKVFLAEKVFGIKPDGKHNFTSQDSYNFAKAYKYKFIEDLALENRLIEMCSSAFEALRFSDYAKFDIRIDEKDGKAYIIDCNPNTAFGPDKGLPMTEILSMYGIDFSEILASLLSKHAKQ
ncbi:MAG TPA: hypothetical protein VLI92_04105 [Candidatus Saccharimonadales bacterium]|nr:hypothetical protein [Candidatus Saccharimonadales bacterium]